jgi:hypothetical protein
MEMNTDNCCTEINCSDCGDILFNTILYVIIYIKINIKIQILYSASM